MLYGDSGDAESFYVGEGIIIVIVVYWLIKSVYYNIRPVTVL